MSFTLSLHTTGNRRQADEDVDNDDNDDVIVEDDLDQPFSSHHQ